MPSACSEFLYIGKVKFLTLYYIPDSVRYYIPCIYNLIVTVGDGAWDNGYSTMKPKNLISSILGGTPGKPKPIVISNPHDFRQVSVHFAVHFLTYDFIGSICHLLILAVRYLQLSMSTYCQRPVDVCAY